MKSFIKLLVCGLFAFGCSSSPDVGSSSLGIVQLNITNVPTTVQCLKIKASDAVRTVIKDVPIINGTADTTPLQGLPTGDVTVGAAAFDVACSSVTSNSVATWLSDPITQIITLVQGQPYNLSFTLRPNGDVIPGVDWVSDTQSPVICALLDYGTISAQHCWVTINGCFWTGNANNPAGVGTNNDPCKLSSGQAVTDCQRGLSCVSTTQCSTSTDMLCLTQLNTGGIALCPDIVLFANETDTNNVITYLHNNGC